jgi:hypothetical protein
VDGLFNVSLPFQQKLGCRCSLCTRNFSAWEVGAIVVNSGFKIRSCRTAPAQPGTIKSNVFSF